MSKHTARLGRGVFAAMMVAAFGFGTAEALASPSAVRSDPICESKCWNKYNFCQQYNLGNCEQTLETCMNNCAM